MRGSCGYDCVVMITDGREELKYIKSFLCGNACMLFSEYALRVYGEAIHEIKPHENSFEEPSAVKHLPGV